MPKDIEWKDLLANPTRPQSFKAAMDALKKARSEYRGALAALDLAERLHGPGSQEARTVNDDVVARTSAADDAAADALARVPAKTPRQAMEKVRALLTDAMTPEAVKILKDDLDRALATPVDPVVELAERFKRIRQYLERHPHIGITETIEDPAIEDAYGNLSDIVQRLETMTPSTPRGVAALADVVWLYSDHNGDAAGTEEWEQTRENNPDARLLARLRHGAHVLSHQ